MDCLCVLNTWRSIPFFIFDKVIQRYSTSENVHETYLCINKTELRLTNYDVTEKQSERDACRLHVSVCVCKQENLRGRKIIRLSKVINRYAWQLITDVLKIQKKKNIFELSNLYEVAARTRPFGFEFHFFITERIHNVNRCDAAVVHKMCGTHWVVCCRSAAFCRPNSNFCDFHKCERAMSVSLHAFTVYCIRPLILFILHLRRCSNNYH